MCGSRLRGQRLRRNFRLFQRPSDFPLRTAGIHLQFCLLVGQRHSPTQLIDAVLCPKFAWQDFYSLFVDFQRALHAVESERPARIKRQHSRYSVTYLKLHPAARARRHFLRRLAFKVG